MLGEEKPPYIQNAPQEEEEDDDPNEILSQNRNISEDQIQPNFLEQGDPMEKILIPPPLNQSSNYVNNALQEDILKKSSLDDINDYQNNNIQNITQPLIQEEIGQPIIQTNVVPVQYNDINENRFISNSYTFSNYKAANNPLISSGINQNQNNLYATVIPLNGETLISERDNYGNNNNLIYETTQTLDNNYQNTTHQIISQYPQYEKKEQNLIFSSPIPENPNLNEDYDFSNNINDLYHTYNPNNINNNLIKGNAKVVLIDENLMKNPQTAKYVEESEKHVNKYLSKIGGINLNDNNNFNNNNINYNNINNNDFLKKSFKNNNENINERINNNTINNINNENINERINNNTINNINNENINERINNNIINNINKSNNNSFNDNNTSKLKLMKNSINNSKYINENSNRSKGSKIKSSNNNNYKNNLEINPNDFNELNNFSPEFWQHFYNKNDPFFTSIDNNNIIHDQTLKNPEKNEVYYGDINNEEQKHGFGKLITPILMRIGNWKNDKFHGWGKEIRNDGKIYEGKFVNDMLNGKGIFKDGGIFYVGNFNGYNKHGKGEIFTSSYHYIGNFNNNNMDGKGRIEIYDEGIYEGNFNNGKMDGYGLYKFKNGDFYEGEMKNGKMDGIGKLTLANGTIYEGNFQDGEFIEKELKDRKMYIYKDNYH